MTLNKIDQLPEDDRTLYDRAERFLDEERYHEAIDVYNDLISRYDPNKLGYGCYRAFFVFRGMALFRLGRFKDAISDFDIVIKRKPKSPNVLFMRAKAKEKTRFLNGALYDYDAVIEIDPTTADAYSSMANIFEFKGEIEKAREFYEKALMIDPSDKLAQSRLPELKELAIKGSKDPE